MAVPVSADGPTLVVLSEAVPAVAESAAAAVRAGGRLYCLAPDGWGDKALPDWLAGAPSTAALIRRVREAPVAAVLSGGRGWLWMGPGGPGEWRLTLEADQMESARMALLDLFWNQADDETWPERGRVQWRARGEPPFDLPRALPMAAVRLEPGGALLEAVEAGGSVYSPDGSLPDGGAAGIWVPPSGDGHAGLADAVGRGSDVVWTDLGLPACATGARAVILARTSRWSMRVTLTRGQAAGLARLLDHEPAARFRTTVQLAEAEAQVGRGGRVWRAGRPQPEALIERQSLSAGVVPAPSLRDMPSAEPSTLPDAAPLALTAHWSWKVAAPRAPQDATEDPLVKTWRELDEGYAARVESALAELGTVGERASRLERTFAAMKNAVLGFGRSRAELERLLLDCGKVTPSVAGPDGADGHLSRLTELETRVRQLGEDVIQAEWKAREAEERERQQREHEQAQEKAREDLQAHERELTEKLRERHDIEMGFGDLGRRSSESGGRMSNAEKKKLKAKRNKLRDDMTRVEKRVQALERLVEQEKAAADRPFEFHPPGRPSRPGKKGSFIPSATVRTDQPVPDEALPDVGRLLRAKKQRFLAIGRWEELDRGEETAGRLGARLVADVEET